MRPPSSAIGMYTFSLSAAAETNFRQPQKGQTSPPSSPSSPPGISPNKPSVSRSSSEGAFTVPGSAAAPHCAHTFIRRT